MQWRQLPTSPGRRWGRGRRGRRGRGLGWRRGLLLLLLLTAAALLSLSTAGAVAMAAQRAGWRPGAGVAAEVQVWSAGYVYQNPLVDAARSAAYQSN